MKKTLHVFISFVLLFLAGYSTAQNMMNNPSLETWTTATQPAQWDVSEFIDQNTVFVQNGSNSAKHTAQSSSKRLQQVVNGVVPGTNYTISYWYLDNDVNAKTRIWAYWLNGTATMADNATELRPGTYSSDNPAWQQYSVTLPAPVGATGFRFEVRVYADVAAGGFNYYDNFYFGTGSTSLPEPTNYPTAVRSAVNMLHIYPRWTDATGTQPPTGYLVRVSNNASLAAPVDGVPIIDDLDMSDGTGYKNVTPGQQTYTFSGLSGNTTYYTKVYPYTNTGSNINYKTDGTVPTATSGTTNLFLVNSQTFEHNAFTPWTTFSVASDKDWGLFVGGGAQATSYFAQINGYQENVPSDDWLISPALNMNTYYNEKLMFFSQWKYGIDDTELKLKYSTNYTTGSPATATWTELPFTKPAAADVWDSSGYVNLSSISGTSVRIAVQYLSNGTPRRWYVDQFEIVGDNVAPAPSIAVVSPNGGEQWMQGTAHNITWNYANITGNVKIELVGANPSVIAASAPNTGTYAWTIPVSQTPASDYKVKISSVSAPTVFDQSDNAFTVVAGLAPVADFVATNINVAVGSTTSFTDQSTNAPTAWAWSFVGGNPPTASVQNPTGIQYNFVGQYNVCLTVTNAFGNHTKCKDAYINVAPSLERKIVITEIMYNSPESGTDSLEFIELYNNGVDPVNMLGYTFSEGVVFTFPDVTIAPQNYLLIAYKASAIQGTFGKTALQWTSGALSNSGELIRIKDAAGVTVDSVFYDDVAPWDSLADGFGPSLVLCDPNLNNSLGANWTHCTTFAAINAAGDTIWATPGAGCPPALPVVGFIANNQTIVVNNSVQFTDQTAGVGPLTYKWSFEGGTPATSTVQNPLVLYSTVGVWDVKLVVTNAGGSDSLTKTDYITVGINPGIIGNLSNSFTLSPNPAREFINLDHAFNRADITIFSLLGKKVAQYSTTSKRSRVSISHLPQGVYLVKLVSDQGEELTRKLIVQ
ncbi:MAG: PKD domain-containing protein [Bacteroidales bacterium]|nr:PKD domain-containing protein [Bacteroidales bacterium]